MANRDLTKGEPGRILRAYCLPTLSRSPGDVRPETLVSDETGGRRVLNSGAYFSCLFGRRFRPSTKPWGCSGGNFGFRGRRRGALRSPTPPRATGAQTKFWFLTEQAGGAFGAAAHVLPRLFGRRFRPPTKPYGCSGGNSGFRRRGRGALCSPTPPRGRGARGFTPSRALPGLFGRRFWFPTEQAGGELLPAALLLPRRFARKFRS